MEGSSCLLVSIVLMVSKNCCRAAFFAESSVVIFATTYVELYSHARHAVPFFDEEILLQDSQSE